MRIISLVPSHTEILFALGLGDHVVGVTSHCDYPPEVEGIERVSSFKSPGAEKIISLRPDLVLADSRLQGSCLKELKGAGIQVFDFFPLTLDGLFAGMEEISSLAGGGESARQVIEGLRAKADELIAVAKRFPTRKLLFVMGREMLATPGPASIQYDVFSSLGLELYPGACHISYIPLTWGEVAHFDPEILLACGRFPGQKERERCPGCRAKNRPCVRDVEDVYQIHEIAGVSAVKKRKVFTVPCHFFCRPGPRLLEGMEWLTGVIKSPF